MSLIWQRRLAVAYITLIVTALIARVSQKLGAEATDVLWIATIVPLTEEAIKWAAYLWLVKRGDIRGTFMVAVFQLAGEAVLHSIDMAAMVGNAPLWQAAYDLILPAQINLWLMAFASGFKWKVGYLFSVAGHAAWNAYAVTPSGLDAPFIILYASAVILAGLLAYRRYTEGFLGGNHPIQKSP